MRIFTLGTAHRPQHDFTRILVKYGIQSVFDVRRVPESREDHFRRSGLQALCSSQGIDYIYLGNELGGPRDGNYKAWVATDQFRRWFSVIRNKLEKRVCCILCAERSPEMCHRRVIGDQLAGQDIEVVHLLDETSTWQPKPRTRRPFPVGRPQAKPRRRPELNRRPRP